MADIGSGRLEILNAKVQQAALRGAWQRERGTRPREEIRPAVWRWNDMAPLLLEAGSLVPLSDAMKMRTLHMANSSEPVPLGATRTFAAMLQHVNGGEITESHRHTATSIYFMIQGSGIYTTAEGEQQFMEPGDLLTQPTWTWHGTTNTGREPALWFTAMDTNLMQSLDVWFAEKYPEGRSQPVTRPDGYHMKHFGPLRPRTPLDGPGPFPVKYPWKDTMAALEDLEKGGETDPYDAVVLEYVDPQTGGSTTATLHCRVQMIRPGEETRAHRHICSAVYFVVQGSGETRVGSSRADENTLKWGARDCFNIPTWHWHRFKNHSSSAPAILFSVTDQPLFQALRLYREQH
jgi:gentisate 1,2-dioxygenase